MGAETLAGFDVKCCYFFMNLTKFGIFRRNLQKLHHFRFNRNTVSGSQVDA